MTLKLMREFTIHSKGTLRMSLNYKASVWALLIKKRGTIDYFVGVDFTESIPGI